jgi:hypothetical protein
MARQNQIQKIKSWLKAEHFKFVRRGEWEEVIRLQDNCKFESYKTIPYGEKSSFICKFYEDCTNVELVIHLKETNVKSIMCKINDIILDGNGHLVEIKNYKND